MDCMLGYCTGNSKIRYFYFTIRRDNNILRFDITMNDMFCMGSLNSSAHLNCNAQCFFIVQLTFFFNIGLEGNTFHIFHDNIMNAILAADIINIDDIRMFQTCCRLCFAAELRHKISIFAEFFLQYFDCHISAKGVILRLIDVRHATSSNLTYDFVAIGNIRSIF